MASKEDRTMITPSPFSLNRFEHENKHIYYLLPKLYAQLEERKSAFIIGSRGTGKTTLLNSLSWKERTSNGSLRRALEEFYGTTDVFHSQYIGVYLKVPLTVESIARWGGRFRNQDVHKRVFALYLNFIMLELILDSITELSLADIIPIKYPEEAAIVKQIANYINNIQPFVPDEMDFTLLNLKRIISRIIAEMINDSLRLLGEGETITKYPLNQAWELGRIVAAQLAALCNQSSIQKNSSWHFKVCFDESEAFNNLQKEALNTLIRNAHNPLFYYVSYVSDTEDITGTYNPAQTLQQADRNIVVVDRLSDGDFRQLAEGVLSVRIKHCYPSYTSTLRLSELLGTININELLRSILEESIAGYAKKLLEEAKHNTSDPFFREANWGFNDTDPMMDEDSLPIYQTYVMRHLSYSAKDIAVATKTQKEQWRAEIRKRIVAAYLSICKELGTSPRYASAEMVLQLSDNCIRDLLLQMEGIYRECELELPRFVETRNINVKKQDKALHEVSSSKIDKLSKLGLSSSSKIKNLVWCFGEITNRLQVGTETAAALKTPEKGLFRIRYSATIKEEKELVDLIEEAAAAGFFVFKIKRPDEITFRIHCSLAPNFNISYRGAYAATSISLDKLLRLVPIMDSRLFQQELEKVINQIVLPGAEELPLFREVGRRDDLPV